MVFVYTFPSPSQYNDDILQVTKNLMSLLSAGGGGVAGGETEKYNHCSWDKIENISVFFTEFHSNTSR